MKRSDASEAAIGSMGTMAVVSCAEAAAANFEIDVASPTAMDGGENSAHLL